MKYLLILLSVIAGLAQSPQIPNDPFFGFNGGTNRITFLSDTSYTASTYCWPLVGSGEQFHLYQNGVYQSGLDLPAGTGSISAALAWNIQAHANDTVVAIVDTGFQLDHEDIAGRFLPGVYIVGSSVTTNIPIGSHGTEMAGVIAAIGNNGIGISGVCRDGVKILPVAGNSLNDMANGVSWASSNGAHIIVIAYGLNLPPNTNTFQACSNANYFGCLLVCAPPNVNVSLDTTNNYDYPSCYSQTYSNILSVTGSRQDEVPFGFAYSTNFIHLFAPCRRIPVTSYTNKYYFDSGNTIASALAAGAAALVRQRYPFETAAQLRERLMASGDVRAAYSGFCVSGASLNLNAALKWNRPMTNGVPKTRWRM